MIRRPPRSTPFPYPDALPICPGAPAREARPDCSRASDRIGRVQDAPAAAQAAREDHALGARTVEGERAVERAVGARLVDRDRQDRKSTRLNSSHANISYAAFC